jgi:F420-dependent oxidoreductase-like protein
VEFGAFVPQGWRLDLRGVAPTDQWDTILGVAQRAESAGYRSLWAYDHFHTVPTPQQEATLECWSLMAGLAAATDRVRLGQMCTSIGYRPPGLLAKMSSTVDVISGGRLEVGIGAGWYDHEYAGYGYEYPRDGVRLAMLREYVAVLKRMWTEDVVDYSGEYYRLDGAINQPKPLQTPHPPLWIAGAGEKVTLRLVAEEADWANFQFSVEEFVHKSRVLARHCENVGRPMEEIGRSSHVEILIAATQAEVARKLDRVCAQRGMEPKEIRDRGFVGTIEEIRDHAGRLEEAGCDHVICYFSDAVWGDGLEMFGSEVLSMGVES